MADITQYSPQSGRYIAEDGSAFGALVGVLANSKMINYHLEQLENRVQAHNNLIDRMYKVERDNELIEEKLKVANHRIDDLERGQHNE